MSREPEGGTRDRGSQASSHLPDDRDTLLEQLRDVNEQLVITSVRAQELADQADAARADAEAANRLKDEFLASVSHELRTPLSAVLGLASLLEGGRLDPTRVPDAIRTIERNAQALARIIDDLLDASRILGGDVRIEPAPVDVVAAVQGALDQVRLAAEAKALRIGFSCPVPPAPVAGDALRLQQVVANLLSNAIKFTPPKGKIQVQVNATASHAEIVVADSGQGIDPVFLPRIFDRFTQEDSSTTRRQGGLGLGLAIVQGLVERHGGTVHAESAGVGHGATFTVRLPTLPRYETAPTSTALPTAPPVVEVRLDDIRVLLVEDDLDVRQVLALVLELSGATVTPVGSVREALQVLGTVEPHVIVSDIGMPGEDGFALVRRLRAREAADGGANIPAIALTGYVAPEDRSRLLAAGFQAHLRKPVEPDELVATVASLVERRTG